MRRKAPAFMTLDEIRAEITRMAQMCGDHYWAVEGAARGLSRPDAIRTLAVLRLQYIDQQVVPPDRPRGTIPSGPVRQIKISARDTAIIRGHIERCREALK